MAPPDSIPTAWELMLFHQVQALAEKLNESIKVLNILISKSIKYDAHVRKLYSLEVDVLARERVKLLMEEINIHAVK